LQQWTSRGNQQQQVNRPSASTERRAEQSVMYPIMKNRNRGMKPILVESKPRFDVVPRPKLGAEVRSSTISIGAANAPPRNSSEYLWLLPWSSLPLNLHATAADFFANHRPRSRPPPLPFSNRINRHALAGRFSRVASLNLRAPDRIQIDMHGRARCCGYRNRAARR